ncbi:HAD-IIB family hydrolase [Sphingomonas morindae]|uniref:phosphomannomutase n=1 Tax=Sphingomonas morindae TaxID=1541170 RepID=A0ABY4XBL6_9SPHN|nr:HAD-IIB family hydrolase [Sphingomonas morindae]USI74365.1 HAD-IIB family hydrolase [Sphingomonas morindae]
MKKLVAFDLDGTLAESKQALDDEMAALLGRLSGVAHVCVISGGDWPQFEKQVVSRLPDGAKREHFWIMPTTGTKLYRFVDGAWACQYADLFSAEEREHIIAEVRAGIDRLGIAPPEIWGEQVEDRGSQITFSALGQEAPLKPKEEWDPKQEKRRRLQADLQPRLPDLSVRIGGATSIDITRKGVDKAYGMERLASLSGIAKAEMLFFGDALYDGGNDAPVRETAGIDSVQVYAIGETKRAVEAVILCLAQA